MKLAYLLCLVPLISGCTMHRPAADCAAGSGTPMRVFELYFGRNINGVGQVTDDQWKQFSKEVISENLPDGYTVFDASGEWMAPKTRLAITEPTKVLVVAAPDTSASMAAIRRVRSSYEKAFQQISVGMTNHPVCASFDR